MKLNSAHISQTMDQLEAEVIEDDHPAMSQLINCFGEHTFLLNSNGLHILERTETKQVGSETAKVIKLASWQDADKTTLKPHKPEPTNEVVVLDTDKPGS